MPRTYTNDFAVIRCVTHVILSGSVLGMIAVLVPSPR